MSIIDEKYVKELVRDDYTDRAVNIGVEIDHDTLADLIVNVSKKIISELQTSVQIIFEEAYEDNPIEKAVK